MHRRAEPATRARLIAMETAEAPDRVMQACECICVCVCVCACVALALHTATRAPKDPLRLQVAALGGRKPLDKRHSADSFPELSAVGSDPRARGPTNRAGSRLFLLLCQVRS